MDKHLNNWLDEVEGKAPETSNNAIKKEMKRQGIDMEENIRQCSGKHKSLKELFSCKPCAEFLDSCPVDYTIKKRTFDAKYETNPQKRIMLNSDTLTSEYLTSYKYQLVCLCTEFLFKTKKECYEQLKMLNIPLR